jgi:hypothetical protein
MITTRTETGIACELEGVLVVAEEGLASSVKAGMNRLLDRVPAGEHVQVVMTKPLKGAEHRELKSMQSEFIRSFRAYLAAAIEDAREEGLAHPNETGLYLVTMQSFQCFLANVIGMTDWSHGKTETDLQRELLAFLGDVSRETITLDQVHDMREIHEQSLSATICHEIPPDSSTEAR